MRGDDERIQGALDQGALPNGDSAAWAAYGLVYAALREEPDFALAPDFARVMAARVMPVRCARHPMSATCSRCC